MPVESDTPDGAADAEDRSIPEGKFRDVVKQRDTLKSELKELRAWRAEREAEAEAAEKDRMMQEGKLKELLQMSEAEKAALKAERDNVAKSWEAKHNTLLKQIRFKDTVDTVASKLGDRTIVEALMLKAERDLGLDVAPEQLTPELVDSIKDAIKKMAPQAFVNTGNFGGSPSVPGAGRANGPPTTADAVTEMAKRRSQRLKSG